MKYVIIGLLLLYWPMQSQNLIVPDCGLIIKKGETVVVDSLIFSCGTTLLLQDDAKLIIKEKIISDKTVTFIHADAGRDTTKSRDYYEKLTKIDENGKIFYDYREPGSVNPQIIFEKCMPKDFVYSAYIDFDPNTPKCEDSTLSVPEVTYSNTDLAEYNCVVYDVLGREIYKGKYKDIPKIYNKVLYIKVFLKDKIYYKKLLIVK